MAETPRQLNDKQAAVLKWIQDGCPEDVYPSGYEHRIVARNLERYGLVTISGRSATWTAELTDAGRGWKSEAPAAELPSVESEADLLIERVIESCGRLLLPKDRDIEKAHEKIVQASLMSPKRPKGKKLVMVSTGAWGSGPQDDHVEPIPVPIPEHVHKYHPAVKAFLEDREWQYVTKEHTSPGRHGFCRLWPMKRIVASFWP